MTHVYYNILRNIKLDPPWKGESESRKQLTEKKKEEKFSRHLQSAVTIYIYYNSADGAEEVGDFLYLYDIKLLSNVHNLRIDNCI